MEKYFDNTKLADVLWKWKTHIIVITFLTAVVGGVVSFLVKPKYESIAITYPSNIIPYSEESETEQVVQIFQSEDIKNNVVNKLGLYTHYKISETSPQKKFYLDNIWKSNVSIFRTPNDAVKIRVLDQDPVMACSIATAIVDEFNLFTRSLHRSKAGEVVDLYNRQRARKFHMLDSLKENMRRYNEMGIYDVPFQAKELAAAMLQGNRSPVVKELQEAFNENSAAYLIDQAWLQGEVLGLEHFMERYDRANAEYDREFTYVTLVSSPEVADKRYSPVRWIYVVLFAIGGFLVSIAAIACIDAVQARSTKKSSK